MEKNKEKLSPKQILDYWITEENHIIKINGEIYNSSDWYKIEKATKNTIKLYSAYSNDTKVISLFKATISECEHDPLTQTEIFLYFPEVSDIYESKTEETKSITGRLTYKNETERKIGETYYKIKYLNYFVEENHIIIEIFDILDRLVELLEWKNG